MGVSCSPKQIESRSYLAFGFGLKGAPNSSLFLLKRAYNRYLHGIYILPPWSRSPELHRLRFLTFVTTLDLPRPALPYFQGNLKMDENLQISLDKLPVKRLEAIEESGAERFPVHLLKNEFVVLLCSDVGYDEKRVSLIRRMRSRKRARRGSMLENLQLAQRELSVIIDLISTQSAKALEQQTAREARFYGALIRLQQNWKVKRQRLAASVPSNEGFIFDLFESSLYDSAAVLRPSNLSTIRVDHDPAGMLAINLPLNSCHHLHFGFLGVDSGNSLKESGKINWSHEKQLRDTERESASDDECIKEAHSLLREAHQAIFYEQVDILFVKAEGAPNVVGLFKGSSENMCSTNKYDCDLADLPVIVLQQVVSQVVLWLHEEALRVGIKANRDFLCLSFELEEGELLSLVARVDPEDTQGCISWWLIIWTLLIVRLNIEGSWGIYRLKFYTQHSWTWLVCAMEVGAINRLQIFEFFWLFLVKQLSGGCGVIRIEMFSYSSLSSPHIQLTFQKQFC
ncbi:hypothetical protein HS088_TW04G01619 [Tripterygium wilfordii]|uniref:Mediator of RNA polymerase II transcription subunit 17 n=1 Tax=Tripterygium wilfordii TaxID=458696 RepID=A0A7J7DTK1_TRIWF|nr:hypothetical protein HS088_TW04G01619 [Tripterygium wilfordii]